MDAAAGFAAGVVSTVALQPVDTVLTQHQFHARAARSAATAVVARGGGVALWRGTLPVVALVPLQNALLMTGYGYGARLGGRRDDGGGGGGGDGAPEAPAAALPVFLGGCAGGFAQSFVTAPLELAKIRRQLFLHVPWRTLARTTTGLAATFWRDVLPHGVWFLAYDRGKAAWRDPADPDGTAAPLAAGAAAAAVAWVAGYPFDLVKTRIQGAAAPLSLADATRGVLAGARTPAAAVAALYRGLGLKLLRAVPASALNFAAYEYARARLLPPPP